MTWGPGGQEPGYAAGPAPRPVDYQPGPVPRHPTHRPMIRGVVLVTLVLVGFAVAALVLGAYYGAALGLTTSLLALVLAALPLGVVIPTFLWLDRYEAEPTRYLVVAFLWGALIAALSAGVFNTGAMLVFATVTDPAQAQLATAVVTAPVVEEAAKGLLVVLIWWVRRREFDGIIDGMVYAGVVAAGFAFTENIQYLGVAYLEGGQGMLAGVFVARGVVTPFAHPIFTVMTGIGIGIAASSRHRALRLGAPAAGYLVAVLLHALWNLAAISGGQGLLVVFLFVEVPIFLAFLALIAWARHREGRLIGRHLSAYADAGWFSFDEVRMLSSLSHRRAARMWARRAGGRPVLRAMQGFQDAASELALLRERMHHSAADDHALDSERHLLDTIVAARRGFAGPGAA